MSLEILESFGTVNSYKFRKDTFKKFNKAQSVLIGYLKMKYPRGGNTFVPGDLMKIFKSFDMVEYPENDILRNAGISFTDSSTKEIVHKLKVFLNSLLDELDEKFPIFQNLLQEKVFVMQEDDKKRQLNFKIGRKIPESTTKYSYNQNDQFLITSPEIFRVIIKWVGDMEEFLLMPEDEVNEKTTFKTYTLSNGKLQFDEISLDEI